MSFLRHWIQLLALDEPATLVDAGGKALMYFGIAISGREFSAGMATAIFGQIAVSLNDPPKTTGEATKRLIGTVLCAFFAAMISPMPIVNNIPVAVLMGCAGALSIPLVKIFSAVKNKADSSADAIADKIVDNVKNKL